jgi:uncharacterized membrane protein YkoI
MRATILLLLMISSSPLMAASSFFPRGQGVEIAAQEHMRPGPQNILPNRRQPRIGDQQAAASVRKAYANHKILSVQLIEAQGSPVYRVKTLSDDGVIKYVFVHGTSGEIFE